MAESSLHQIPKASYVYEIVVNGIVRYIGKGTGKRAARHLTVAKSINRRRESGEVVKARKFYNQLAKILRDGSVVECRIVVSGLSSHEAFAKEIEAIAAAPAGQLWNELSGGQGLSSEDAKRMWSDRDFRTKVLSHRRSDEFRSSARAKTIAHFSNPEERDKSRARTKALWDDPSFRRRGTKLLQDIWNDEQLRERHKLSIARAWAENPERRAVRGRITKEWYWSRPEHARRIAEQFRQFWRDPDLRKKMTAHWDNPERKREIISSWTPEFLKKRGRAISEGQAKSEAMQKLLSDPDRMKKLAERNRTYWRSPEAKAKQSENMRALWANPEHRAKTMAHWAEKRRAKDDRS